MNFRSSNSSTRGAIKFTSNSILSFSNNTRGIIFISLELSNL